MPLVPRAAAAGAAEGMPRRPEKVAGAAAAVAATSGDGVEDHGREEAIAPAPRVGTSPLKIW